MYNKIRFVSACLRTWQFAKRWFPKDGVRRVASIDQYCGISPYLDYASKENGLQIFYPINDSQFVYMALQI